jgi:hypothetical protein
MWPVEDLFIEYESGVSFLTEGYFAEEIRDQLRILVREHVQDRVSSIELDYQPSK